MDLKELALRTREEIEQDLNKMCPLPENPQNPGDYDQVFDNEVEIRKTILRYQVEALLDGKLTIDQVVAQQHSENDEKDVDDIHRNRLEAAIDELKEGKNREDIVTETVNCLELV